MVCENPRLKMLSVDAEFVIGKAGYSGEVKRFAPARERAEIESPRMHQRTGAQLVECLTNLFILISSRMKTHRLVGLFPIFFESMAHS